MQRAPLVEVPTQFWAQIIDNFLNRIHTDVLEWLGCFRMKNLKHCMYLSASGLSIRYVPTFLLFWKHMSRLVCAHFLSNKCCFLNFFVYTHEVKCQRQYLNFTFWFFSLFFKLGTHFNLVYVLGEIFYEIKFEKVH